MFLEFGKSIGNTLQSLFNQPVTDELIESSIKNISLQMIKANVNPAYVAVLRDNIKEKIKKTTVSSNTNRAKMVQKAVYESLIDLLDPKTLKYEIKSGKSNVIVFVGLQGSGKTTSICKYANFYKKKGFRTGIVCADTFRAGAFDQVKQNVSKIGIPFYGSDNPDPVKVAMEGVSKFKKNNFELILVDTSGRHSQEDALFKEMSDLVNMVKPDNIVFVMDAGIGQSAEDQAKEFRKNVNIGGIILTKLDGTSKTGGALSSVAVTGCPIEFVGTGEGMEDLEPFNPKSFVSKMLGMGDIEGLMEKFSEIDINQEEIMEKMVSGDFTLKDFRKLYTQILSLGPLTKLLEMIPGMSGLKNKGLNIPSEEKLQRLNYIFSSMSRSELNSDGEEISRCSGRQERIARGCGIPKEEILEFIRNFKMMGAGMKKLMKNPMFSGLFGGSDVPTGEFPFQF